MIAQASNYSRRKWVDHVMRGLTVGALAHNLEIWLKLQKRRQIAAREHLVVHYQRPNVHERPHSRRP